MMNRKDPLRAGFRLRWHWSPSAAFRAGISLRPRPPAGPKCAPRYLDRSAIIRHAPSPADLATGARRAGRQRIKPVTGADLKGSSPPIETYEQGLGGASKGANQATASFGGRTLGVRGATPRAGTKAACGCASAASRAPSPPGRASGRRPASPALALCAVSGSAARQEHAPDPARHRRLIGRQVIDQFVAFGDIRPLGQCHIADEIDLVFRFFVDAAVAGPDLVLGRRSSPAPPLPCGELGSTTTGRPAAAVGSFGVRKMTSVPACSLLSPCVAMTLPV